MFYSKPITIPAQTLESDPIEKYLPLGLGTITRWFIGFPPGCAGLVHVTIYRFEHQILPEGEGQDLYWDGYMFVIEERYALVDEPYEVKIVCWNNDDSYEHTIYIGVEIMPIPEETTESLLQRLLRALVGE